MPYLSVNINIMRNVNHDYLSEYIRHIDRNNNMGIVRYVLAFGVLIAHFNVLCGADVSWIISSENRVGGFFALSGFVLFGGILKITSFKQFVIKRAWRILPSYFFVVITGAVLFSLISTFSFKDYFTSKDFWGYLAANLSFLNFLHPTLPGVFSDLDIKAVNGALWTMKVEWQLTLSAPILVWLCRKYLLNLKKFIFITLIVSLLYRILFEFLYLSTEKQIFEILGRQFFGQLLFFYTGVLIYLSYDKFIKYKVYFIIASVSIYFSEWFLIDIPNYHTYIQPFVITFLVLSLSMISGDIGKYIDGGNNISYEIFLCHYPVMQMIAYFDLINKYGTAISLAIGITATIICAAITYYSVGNLYKRKRSASSKTMSSPVLSK